jgi:nucleotide-binding universal stress UspA family protein
VAWKRNILVVANVTATSPELVRALKAQVEKSPAAFTLIVPATPFGGGRAAAKAKLQEAVNQLREAGIEIDGHVGEPDPVVAVTEAWDPKRYDEIIISTLPMRVSKWLHAGLPERCAKLTGAPVTHVVSEPEKPAAETVPPPSHDSPSQVMGPLGVLAWGGHKEH